MVNKKLDFQASISDVQQINPLFSTCRVRVLYTGKNRNMSIITKEAVERAMPTLKNIPIVGEFSESAEDYKGHGGQIDLDSYKYVHTTKPYGVVPESATYSWETVRGADGSSRDYLVIEGCYLWTGRYEEAYSIVEKGKGQSMEIEVTDGQWNEQEEAYQIDNFIYSALCILGDDVEPAFENANITSYSFKDAKFQTEFTSMLSELDTSLTNEKEVKDEMIKELLKKYSTSMEVLTEKGLKFEEISEQELEAKIAEALEVAVITDEDFEVVVKEQNAVEVMKEIKDDEDRILAEAKAEEAVEEVAKEEVAEEAKAEEAKTEEVAETVEEVKAEEEVTEEVTEDENLAEVDAEVTEEEVTEEVVDEAVTEVADASAVQEATEETVEETVDFEALKNRIAELEGQLVELNDLKEFKLNIQKAEHADKVQKMFSNFQFTEEDIKDLDIHAFTLEEIEEKCYMIFGRKVATKKNFSKANQKEEGLRLPIGNANQETNTDDDGYGGLIQAVKQ